MMCLVLDMFRVTVQRRLMIDDHRRPARNGRLDANVKMSPLLTMPVRKLDDDVATNNPGIELFQPCDALTDRRLEPVGVRETAKSDLNRNHSHNTSPAAECSPRANRLPLRDLLQPCHLRRGQA
jgi:hypothetical protein